MEPANLWHFGPNVGLKRLIDRQSRCQSVPVDRCWPVKRLNCKHQWILVKMTDPCAWTVFTASCLGQKIVPGENCCLLHLWIISHDRDTVPWRTPWCCCCCWVFQMLFKRFERHMYDLICPRYVGLRVGISKPGHIRQSEWLVTQLEGWVGKNMLLVIWGNGQTDPLTRLGLKRSVDSLIGQSTENWSSISIVKMSSISPVPASLMWIFAGFSCYDSKLIIFGFWTVGQTRRAIWRPQLWFLGTCNGHISLFSDIL